MKRRFFKYITNSALGMLGISLYILVDTFFISLASGSDGITVLNLVLPLYWIIYAIAAMIGVGSSTYFNLYKANNENGLFMHALLWQLLISIPFFLLGVIYPIGWLKLMGGDNNISTVGKEYVEIVLLCTPIFITNYTFTSFVRNDCDTRLVMIADILTSALNILFDYLFMFTFKMGLGGAALATAICTFLSSSICAIHFFKKSCTIDLRFKAPRVKLLFDSCKLGFSSFIGEITGAVTTTTFNFLILGLAGNVGIAAYGIVANIAMVSLAIFNGIAQGTQPLVSECTRTKDYKNRRLILKLGLITNFSIGLILVLLSFIFTDGIIKIFNTENNESLSSIAYNAIRFYSLGYLLASINIIIINYYSSSGRVKIAFILSIIKGIIAISLSAIIMSLIFKLNGIWLSFIVSEFITLIFIFILYRRKKDEESVQELR